VGIVSNVAPLLRAPRLIRTVKQAGLLLLTYGGANNEPDNVRLQRQWGVDTIIAGARRVGAAGLGGRSAQLTQAEALAKRRSAPRRPHHLRQRRRPHGGRRVRLALYIACSRVWVRCSKEFCFTLHGFFELSCFNFSLHGTCTHV